MYRLIPNEGWTREEQQQIRNHTSFTSELFAYGFVHGRYMPSIFFTERLSYGQRIIGMNNNGQSASITITVNK